MSGMSVSVLFSNGLKLTSQVFCMTIRLTVSKKVLERVNK